MIPGLKVKITKIPKQFKCEFCGNEYSKESTLVVHLCEKKRRFQAKNEKHVQLGYRAFIRYWNLCQNYQKTKSFDEFTQSSLYLGFVYIIPPALTVTVPGPAAVITPVPPT